MPSPSVQGTLSIAGQTLQLALGRAGVGQPGDVTAGFSMTGTFANAVIGLEGVPLGQPLSAPVGAGPQPSIGPLTLSEWIPIGEVAVINGASLSSPVTISSAGGVGTGFQFIVGCALFQALQMRLISIGSGAIVGGIATIPFPLNQGLSVPGSAQSLLELQRIRLGISILISGGADSGGLDLEQLTSSDFQTYQ